MSRRLCAAALCLAACSDRPALTTSDETTTTTTDTTTTTATATSSTPTTGLSTSTATTDAITTDAITTDAITTDAITTDAITTDSTGTTTDATTGTTTTGVIPGPPSECGPPCAETWELGGDLIIGTEPADYACLTHVHGDVRAWEDNPAAVATLVNLVRVDGELSVFQQLGLPDLSTFACVREVGWLHLSSMPQIVDLAPLDGLRVAPIVELRDLGITALPLFAPDYAGIEGLSLIANPALIDLGPAAGWPLAADGFSLYIESSLALTSIADLAGLITEADGPGLSVSLRDLPALESLAGLETITGAGGVSLSGLPKITDLAELASLVTSDFLSLDDLPGLTSLTGLGALKTVIGLSLGTCADFTGLDGLTSLAGLDSLQSVEVLSIHYNDNLASLTGAPMLTQVSTLELDLLENPMLTQAELDAFIAQLDQPPAPPRRNFCPL
jgi:hypothetical protein